MRAVLGSSPPGSYFVIGSLSIGGGGWASGLGHIRRASGCRDARRHPRWRLEGAAQNAGGKASGPAGGLRRRRQQRHRHFPPFHPNKGVKFLGAEAAGCGIESGKHSCSISAGSVGVFQGSKSYLLQDKDGMVHEAHSIAAGLDYPGVGPEHSYLKDIKRADT